MFEALTILPGLVLLGWALWEQKQYTGGARQLREPPLFCEWCISRDGEICTHSGSPVYEGSCGLVCIGDLRCKVREVRR
jgi:hypothetical protein